MCRELISVPTQSFEKLSVSSKLLDAASLACLTVAVVFLIARAAYHRIVFAGQDTEEVHRVGSRFIALSTIPLLCGSPEIPTRAGRDHSLRRLRR